MENQMPTMFLSSSEQLAIVPFNQIIHPQIISNQSSITQPDHNHTQSYDEKTGWRKLIPNLVDEFHRHYTIEQLLMTSFYWIMITTSKYHVVLGFELLDKTGLSTSMSPIVLSFFKYSLAVFTSLARVDAYHPPSKRSTILKKGGFFGVSLGLPLAHFLTPVNKNYRVLSAYFVSDFLYMFCTGGFSCGQGKRGWLLNFGLYWLLHIIVMPTGARISTSSSDLVIVISVLTSFIRVANSDLVFSTSSALLLCFLDKRITKLFPVATKHVKSALKKKKMWKFAKYAISLVGTLLFQNFFRLKTFDHVKAFMYLASSWLTNLAVIDTSDDFGVLNFILGNVILGSTVNQSGLEINTWLAYGVCLFLYTFDFKLKSMKSSRNLERLPKPPMIVWIFYGCIIIDCVFYLSHHI